jgi:hypothetical protein
VSVSRLSKQSIQAGFPKQQTFWDQSTAVPAMDPIGGITLSANTATITFSNIPQTYTHLQLRWVCRTNGPALSSWSGFTFGSGYNSGDTGYSDHYIQSAGTTPGSGTETLSNRINGFGTTNSSVSNLYGSGIIDILDYTNTNKTKVIRMVDGWDNNGAAGTSTLRSGLWNSTSAVTTLTMGAEGFATTYGSNSTFALYGIK